MIDSLGTEISETSSLINRNGARENKIQKIKPLNINSLTQLKFIPGFPQFPGVKVCLIIGFLHRLFLYTTLTFLENLSNVRGHADNTHNNLNASTLPESAFNENSYITGILYLSLSYVLAPIPGILADKYLPRRTAILISLVMCAIGAIIESILHTLVDKYKVLENNEPTERNAIYYSVHCLSIILKIVGNAGVIALLVPFGIDQMEEAGEIHINSFFYWFYWAQNLGGIAVFGNYVIFKHKNKDLELLLINSYISTAAISLAILVFLVALLFKLLQWNKPIGSPIKKIYKVAIHKAKKCILNRTRNWDADRDRMSLEISRLNYSGGKYFEIVEDVKTFFRILLVLVIMIWYFGLYGIIDSIYPNQGRDISCAENNLYPQCLVNLSDEFVIVMLIPISQFLKRKFKSIRFPKILYKFVCGVFVFTLAVYSALAVDIAFYTKPFCNTTQIIENEDHTVGLLILPIIPQSFLMGVSEVLAAISAMEFVYAQSPNDMKGFVFGLMNMMIGLGTLYPQILNTLLRLVCNSCTHCDVNDKTCRYHLSNSSPFYVFNLVIAIITTLYLLLFIAVAKKYTRRKRQPLEVWPN